MPSEASSCALPKGGLQESSCSVRFVIMTGTVTPLQPEAASRQSSAVRIDEVHGP